MKLIDFIESINDWDESSIIFLENQSNRFSDIIFSFAEEGDSGIKIVNEINYFYLIEVFLAKEFVEDWVSSLNYTPTSDETAKRLYEYSIYDA
jgi:hypothetical protein